MAQLFKNNAVATLLASISDSALSMTISSGSEVLFPTIVSPSDFFIVTLENNQEYEIVKVTATAGNIFTIVRAQEGSIARSWSAGSAVELRLTAGGIEKLQADTGTLTPESVNSIAILKTLTGVIDKTTVKTLGYYDAGDDGGGDYWIDLSDTTSTDNGGTVIVANDGARWKLIHFGEISLLQFGADKTGVASSAQALQNAFATLLPIYAPTGEYLIDEQIDYGDAALGIGMTGLRGDGRQNTIFNLTAMPTPNAKGERVVFNRLGGADRLGVWDCSFDGDGNQTAFGNDGTTSDWARVKWGNLRFGQGLLRGVSARECVFVSFENTDFLCSYRGFRTENTYNQNVEFRDCFFREASDSGGYGLEYLSSSASFNNTLTLINCEFDDCDSGMYAENCRVNLINCGSETHIVDHFKLVGCEVFISSGHLLPTTTGSTGFRADGCQVTEAVSMRFVNAGNFTNTIVLTNSSTWQTGGSERSGTSVDSTSSYASFRARKGTYSPTVYGATSAGSATYSVQSGSWRDDGNERHVQIRLTWTGHTGTGSMRVTLPANSATTAPRAVALVQAETFTWSGQIMGLVLENSDHIRIRSIASGASATDTTIAAAGTLVIDVTYQI